MTDEQFSASVDSLIGSGQPRIAELEEELKESIRICERAASSLEALKRAVKSEHERAEAMAIGHARYECLRRLNVDQFRELWVRAFKGEAPFDELVDGLRHDEYVTREDVRS